jgi:hypothetical protein
MASFEKHEALRSTLSTIFCGNAYGLSVPNFGKSKCVFIQTAKQKTIIAMIMIQIPNQGTYNIIQKPTLISGLKTQTQQFRNYVKDALQYAAQNLVSLIAGRSNPFITVAFLILDETEFAEKTYKKAFKVISIMAE